MSDKTRVALDAMGGDNAPESAVWGGALAAKEYGEEVLLVGKPEVVANVLKEKGLSEVKGITIMPANDLVDMHDDPATVLRRKPDSSMAVAFKQAVEAGRMAYEAGLGIQADNFVAEASSPLTAFLNEK